MSYSIIKADFEKDREDIIALWKRNLPEVPEGRYSWIYEGNLYSTVICFLAKETGKDGLVGATALFPRKISVHKNCYMSAIAGDFVIDANHRGFGPALSLQKAALSSCNEGNFALLYGLPNKQSEAVLLRAGYTTLGQVLRMTKPLRSDYYLKKHIDVSIVAKVLSKPVDLAAKVISKESHYRRSRKYSIDSPSTFDERFDVLWETVSSCFPIIGERSSVYLNWRYKHSPYNNYSVFAVSHKEDGSLLGYIVYFIVDSRTNIVDLLCVDMHETLDSLLSEFLVSQREEGIASISITYAGTQRLTNKLKEFGFSIREKENKVLLFISPDFPLRSSLLETENWYLLPGDNDL